MRRTATLCLLLVAAACTTKGDPGYTLRQGPPGLAVADAALGAGSPGTALNVARIILARSPRDSAALVRQGEALAELGRTNEAVDSFNQAILVDPGAAPAHLGVARLLLMQGEPARAEAELKLALDKDPRDVRVLVNIGIARDLLGRHGEAQTAYQQALTLSPGLTAARVNMGLSLALAGDGDDATTTLRPIAEQPNASSAVRHDLAVALAISGHSDEAERAMMQDLPSSEVRSAIALYRTLKDKEP